MRTARNVAFFLIKVQFFYTKNAILPTKCGVSEDIRHPQPPLEGGGEVISQQLQ